MVRNFDDMSKHQTVLVCESTEKGTDKRLIEKLIISHSLLPNDTFCIETRPPGDIKTIKGFLKSTLSVQPYVISKETKNILVIVDADEHPETRFQEIKTCFDTQIFEVQESLGTQLPIDNTKINVGIYLLPDNSHKGSLETLGLKALYHDNLTLKLGCIDSYMQGLGSIDGSITENNKSKAKFRIFMATPRPDRYVDSIIGSIDFNSEEFNNLKDFIRQVNRVSSRF
jgi:hypothetical protein